MRQFEKYILYLILALSKYKFRKSYNFDLT